MWDQRIKRMRWVDFGDSSKLFQSHQPKPQGKDINKGALASYDSKNRRETRYGGGWLAWRLPLVSY